MEPQGYDRSAPIRAAHADETGLHPCDAATTPRRPPLPSAMTGAAAGSPLDGQEGSKTPFKPKCLTWSAPRPQQGQPSGGPPTMTKKSSACPATTFEPKPDIEKTATPPLGQPGETVPPPEIRIAPVGPEAFPMATMPPAPSAIMSKLCGEALIIGKSTGHPGATVPDPR